MNISVNGTARHFPKPLNIEQLIGKLKLSSAHVVIELNNEILSKDQFSSRFLKENDRLEIVQFVGGG